jgi:hypothetical protein
MNNQQWRNLIISSLSDMTNESLQRRAWSGVGPEVSSLVETICGVLDDALLIEYTEKYSDILSPEIISDVNNLDLKIKRLDTEYLDTLPVLEVIDSPEWAEIRGIAEKLKSAFEREPIAE